jgi:hypothetical protein
MSIRERIKSIHAELGMGNPTPELARRSAMLLAAWNVNVLEEVRIAELEYRAKVAEIRPTVKSRVDAETFAQAGPEYARLREAEDYRDICKTTMGLCKVVIDSLTQEMRFQPKGAA